MLQSGTQEFWMNVSHFLFCCVYLGKILSFHYKLIKNRILSPFDRQGLKLNCQWGANKIKESSLYIVLLCRPSILSPDPPCAHTMLSDEHLKQDTPSTPPCLGTCIPLYQRHTYTYHSEYIHRYMIYIRIIQDLNQQVTPLS